jgi:hypothetical protein
MFYSGYLVSQACLLKAADLFDSKMSAVANPIYGQFHKHFTRVTYGSSKICLNFHCLHDYMHCFLNALVNLAIAVSYGCKSVYEIGTCGQFHKTFCHNLHRYGILP